MFEPSRVVIIASAYGALAAAAVAVATQLWRWGRAGAPPGRASLWAHRVAGYAAAVLFVFLWVGMVLRARRSGGGFDPRIVWHAAAGFSLVAVLLMKWAVVRPLRNGLKFAPALGLTLFALAFVAVNLGAARGAAAPPVKSPAPLAPGGAASSVAFAEKCGRCHHLRRVFGDERTAAEWRAVIGRMQGYAKGGITDADAVAVAAYLTSD